MGKYSNHLGYNGRLFTRRQCYRQRRQRSYRAFCYDWYDLGITQFTNATFLSPFRYRDLNMREYTGSLNDATSTYCTSKSTSRSIACTHTVYTHVGSTKLFPRSWCLQHTIPNKLVTFNPIFPVRRSVSNVNEGRVGFVSGTEAWLQHGSGGFGTWFESRGDIISIWHYRKPLEWSVDGCAGRSGVGAFPRFETCS